MDWSSADKVLIIGHRGASASAPENTMAAFHHAAEEGADGIELDVRLSCDGHAMVVHDESVNRTTDGDGVVSRMTRAELQALDAGAGQPVPALEEVFKTFGRELLYNVELKAGGVRDRGLEATVAQQIAAHRLERKVIVSSFNPLSVRRARRHLSPETMTAVIWTRRPYFLTHFLPGLAADHPHHSLVNEKYMAHVRARGQRVHAWTVDAPAEAKRLVALGVHALITNNPDLLRKNLPASAS